MTTVTGLNANRRTVLSGMGAALLLSGPAMAEEQTYFTGDAIIGNEDAPVTVYEYASFTCPHCASFHINTWPKLKAEYIDTGKVKFILREVYFDQYGLWASMTARCGGEKGYYPLVDEFLNKQSVWTRSDDIGAAIQKIGRAAGLSSKQLTSCLSDRDYARELLANYQDNAGKDQVQSTPTFIINGEHHSGNMNFDDFAKLLEEALGA
jgi:protein-disulfide isomerase